MCIFALFMKMQKGKQLLDKMPPWILSGVTLVAILWLTLSPKPLGDVSTMLFPGFDKVAHALMFGFFTFTLLVDKSRSKGWCKLPGYFIIITAVAVSLLGIIIEFLQMTMNYGRSFEITDIIADTAGTFIVAIIWKLFNPR